MIIKYTQKYWLLVSGQEMPEERVSRLRTELAGVTKDMQKVKSRI